MMSTKKYLVVSLVVGGIVLVVGGRELSRNSYSKANRSEIKRSEDMRPVGADKSESSVAARESSASAGNAELEAPKFSSGLNATGTLNDQVERAFATRDGRLAANLAAQLEECHISQMILDAQSSMGAHPRAYLELPADRMEQMLAHQRNISYCQTVPGDHVRVRLCLLDVAMQQGVVGAATASFLTGSREHSTLQRMVIDASLGDINSMLNVALYEAKFFGIAQDEQDAVRYALKLASADPIVGERAAGNLYIAESYAVPNSHFDFSGISSEARRKGAEIAERLKARLREK